MSKVFIADASKNNTMELDRMGVYRLYSGEDGQSHIEELSEDFIKDIKLDGSSMNFSVSNREPGHFSGYHPAPRRRWQVGVVGRTIIGLGDGSSHTFSPGDVRLIEDLTGQGHTTTYPDGYNVTLQVTASEDIK